jgi:hypothetical protein
MPLNMMKNTDDTRIRVKVDKRLNNVKSLQRSSTKPLQQKGYKMMGNLIIAKEKPRFKKFEMHGNLPFPGTLVSASMSAEEGRYTSTQNKRR